MPSPSHEKPPSDWKTVEAELNKFANGAELRNVAYIKALCQAFQEVALKYYHAKGSSEERLQRIGEISHALKEIAFKAGKKKFTTAAKEVKTIRGEDYTCDPPMICVDGNCVRPPGDGG